MFRSPWHHEEGIVSERRHGLVKMVQAERIRNFSTHLDEWLYATASCRRSALPY
jgi:hypothetical protein